MVCYETPRAIAFGTTLLARRMQFHHNVWVEHAYIDVFKVMAIIFFAVIPLLLFVKRSKPGEVALGH